MKAARNSAIGCACLLAVIEGVGIGIQRMMAENTRLDVSRLLTTLICTFSNQPYPLGSSSSPFTTTIRDGRGFAIAHACLGLLFDSLRDCIIYSTPGAFDLKGTYEGADWEEQG